MKRTDIRKIFTGRKKALAGCLAAVIVLAGGFNVWQSSQVPEFPNFTDPVVETTITEDDTPLASKPKVTTKTTSNTKTTRKKVKLKKRRPRLIPRSFRLPIRRVRPQRKQTEIQP